MLAALRQKDWEYIPLRNSLDLFSNVTKSDVAEFLGYDALPTLAKTEVQTIIDRPLLVAAVKM